MYVKLPLNMISSAPDSTSQQSTTPATTVATDRDACPRFRSVLLILGAIIATGVAFRSYWLSERSLWFDEAFTWRLIGFPWGEMLERVGRDNHPPLYFLLLKGWTSVFGVSVAALRSLSVLLGGLTILGMYLFAAEAFALTRRRADSEARAIGRGRGIGLFVAALVAFSVFQIRWAWETRMYTLGTALAAFSSWALFRALRPGAGARQWVLYGFLTLLFVYTHYYALFSIAAQGMFLAGLLLVRARGNPIAVLRDNVFWHALLAATILVVGGLPWLSTFLRQRAQVQADYWSQPVSRWDVPKVCWQMFVDPEHADSTHDEALIAAIVCGGVLLALLWKPRAGEWYVFFAAGVPIGLSVLVSFLDTKVFHLRFCLFAHLFLLAALAVLVWRVPWPLERGLFCIVVLVVFFFLYADFWQRLDVPSKPGIRGATDFIVSRRQPGEPVVVCSPLYYFSMLYHLELYFPGNPYT